MTRRWRGRAVLALVVVVSAALGACGSGGAGPGDGGSGSAWPTGRTFVSTAVTEGGKDRPLVAGTQVEIRFPREGELSLHAGCNYIGGMGRVRDGRLTVTDLSSTAMGCGEDRMRQDAWLVALLNERPAWSLSGGELVLTGGEAEIRLAQR